MPAAVALIAAVSLTGCGGSSSSTASVAVQAAARSHTASTPGGGAAVGTSQASPTSTPGGSAPTTTGAPGATGAGATGGAAVGGPSPCRAEGLALTYLGGQGATGHGELGFALRNTGQSSCSTGGYPGIQFLDGAGGALPTSPTHTTSDFFGTLPLAALTVKPGDSFSFRLGVSHGGGSGAGCVTAEGLQVIAPNDTATLTVRIPGGASECGAATVSPVQPGDSAYR